MAPVPPIFLFIVDVCLDDDAELRALRDTIVIGLGLLPANALVGLITYGTMVCSIVLKAKNAKLFPRLKSMN